MSKYTLSLAVFFMALIFSSCGSDSETSHLFERDIEDRFPSTPDPVMTPGETCQRADYYRYPERIAYCERNVSADTKYGIIRKYDKELGYSMQQMNRYDFKIDHFIPLCMGGSNSTENLWPQHKSIYDKTDPLEGPLCQLMAQGKLKQAKAIEMMREAKLDLSRVSSVEKRIKSLSCR